MTVRTAETELKYDADAGTTLPAFDRLPQVASVRDAPAEHLEAEYYDTSDLRLIRAGITLRRREGGHDAGWHLKLPVGGDTRREIRVPLGARKAVPVTLTRLVRAQSRGRELRPVATISTDRQRLLLVGQDGAELAEVAADDVIARAMGGAARVSRWTEVEVELTGGRPEVLYAADRLLRAGGLNRSAQSSKLARALGLPAASAASARKLTAAATAGQVVLAYLRAQNATLTSFDPMVRGGEPDSVHQMRIAARRLRSTLQTFGQFFRPPDTEHLAAELRWVGQVLGRARDAEVLTSHLTERLSEVDGAEIIGPVRARVAGHLARARADSGAEVAEALDSDRYFALLDRLDSFLADPPLTRLARKPARAALPPAVRRSCTRTRKRIRRAWRAPAGDRRDQALHRARRAAKRARYAGEVAAPVFGDAGKFARQMKRVQSVLGEHQDVVIARQFHRQLGMAAHLAGENAFTYGLLFDREDQAAARLRRQAKRAWRKASRPRYRRWLG